ncbi:IPT/TIG domain-containing protein [Actinoplanes sp. NPDC020271]|uniref:IPT/TIG domain-containing protein n=1 Tax=Actinoplanes sp. NPDC020271 TaxID=3363896 RepID=UPI00378CBB7D
MATSQQARRAAALTVATAAAVTLASSPATAITRGAGPEPSTVSVGVRAVTKVPTVTAVSAVSGTTGGGTTVTVTGSGFTTLEAGNAAAVKFGDVNAKSFTVVSDTKLTAVTPAGTGGAVLVKVTNSAGTSAGSATFTYRAPLTATFKDVTGAKPTGGTPVDVTVTGGTVGTTFKEFAAEKLTAKVGDATAAVAWVDATHVKVTTPASTKSTAQRLTLTHDGVTGPASENTIRYAPKLTSVVPAKVSTAGGETVTITGSGFSDEVTGVTFGETKATSFAVKSATQITAVVPAGANGAAAVTVTSAGGTASGLVTYRAPLGVKVADGTAVRASGGSVTLEVTGGTVGATAKEYAAEKITASVGTVKVTPSWVDATHVKLTLPSSTAATGSVTLLHDGVAGTAATVGYVPVVVSLSATSDKVAGGAKVTVKIAGGEATGAKDFKFGSTAADCTPISGNAYSCVVPKADKAGPTWVTFTAGTGTTSRFTPSATFNYTDLD